MYDALWAAEPDQASRVIDREDGECRSLRVVVPIQSSATIPEQAIGMRDVAAAGSTEGISAIAVSTASLTRAELSQTADSILETLLIALAAVGVLLTVVCRLVAGTASLGTITAVPISCRR